MYLKRLLTLLAALPLAVAPVAAYGLETTTDLGDADSTTTAQTDDTETADDTGTTSESSSEATALEVDGVATISGTSADTRDGGSAEADAVSLGGETVVGGSQEGEGSSSGELVSTGDNEQGYLDVAPWEAQVDGDGDSSSRAALADGNLGGEGGISLRLLESRSEATRDGSSAESTGVYLNLGGNEFVLLYAQTSSDGSGESYLVNLGGERIGTDDDFDGNCEIPADPIANINCVEANMIAAEDLPEGADSGGEAFVGDLEVLDGNLQGEIIGGQATQGASPAAGGDDVAPAPAPAPEGDDEPESSNAEGRLPHTGAGLGAMLLGLTALGSGEALRRWKR